MQVHGLALVEAPFDQFRHDPGLEQGASGRMRGDAFRAADAKQPGRYAAFFNGTKGSLGGFVSSALICCSRISVNAPLTKRCKMSRING